VAIAVNEAKVLAHRAAIEVSSQFFELTGARATSQKLGLDRFWRNARVHTLHDPIDYKYRDIGRYLLDGQFPEPTSYS
jgi:alkylation response protein AidB-like acyl-CoA dehydrogenase